MGFKATSPTSKTRLTISECICPEYVVQSLKPIELLAVKAMFQVQRAHGRAEASANETHN